MKVQVFFILLLLFLFTRVQAQTAYKQTDISKILQSIEQSSDWTFNYDPSALAAYPFSGQLKKGDTPAQLHQLFYKTPYTFEINENTVLIFLETPKTYSICGTIKDQESLSTLPLANVFLDDQKQGTQSDNNGFFEVVIKAHKHQVITFSYIGYQSQSLMVQEFNQEDCQYFSLALDPALFGEEIIVRDYILQEITEGESYNSVRFDYQKLLNKYTIIEQDILKTVQLIPGVTSIDESATNLQIRGGTPDQNLIIWEDVTLYDPGHLFGMISAINPYVIEEVQIFKGVFDPKYDNRVGGIVDLSLSDTLSNQLHGGIGMTLTEAHAYLKIPVFKDKLGLIVSGRNTVNSLFNSPTITNFTNKVFKETKIESEQEEFEANEREVLQKLEFYDLNSKLIFTPIDRLSLKASWFRTHNAFTYESLFFEDELISKDEVSFDSEAFNLSSNFEVNKEWSIQLGYSSSDYKNDYNFTLREEEDDFVFYDNLVMNSILDQTFFVSTTYQWRPTLNFSLGYDYNKKAVDFNVNVMATYEEEFADFNSVAGHFHNTHLGFNFQKNKFSLNGGLRNTFYYEAQNNKISPRLNLQLALTDNLKLKGAGGIFHQYISQLKEFGENSLGLNNQVWILNRIESEEEVAQTAKKLSVGFVFHKNGWLLDVEGYFNKTAGLSTFTPSFNSVAGSDLDFSLGSSTAKGIDFLLKKRWQSYHIWLNYSLSKVDFFFPEIVDEAFPATNDQRHKFSLVNTWQYKNWNFSLNYQFKTSLPFTDAIGIGEDVGIDEETGEEEVYYFVEYDQPNTQRLQDYSRLDIGFSYCPKFKNARIQSEISFSLINLLNTDNDLSLDYYLDEFETDNGDTELEILDINRGLLKRTPLVSLRLFW